MNFAKTTSSDFEILKNGVDDRLTIIRHKPTGFYNITKLRNMIETLKKSSPDYDNKSIKETKRWSSNLTTIEITNEIKYLTGLERVGFELHAGTRNEFKGRYVHELLVDHFLIWLDPSYGVKVSLILRKYHMDANRALLIEKDNMIDRLEKKIDEERELSEQRFNEVTKRHEEIMRQFGIAITDREAKHNETIAELNLTQAKVENYNQQVNDLSYNFNEALTVMKDMSKHVAPVSSSASRDPILAIVSQVVMDKHDLATIVIHFIRGQRSYVQCETNKFLIGAPTRKKSDSDSPLSARYQITLPPINIPDQNNLVDNAKTKFKDLCKTKINAHNNLIKDEIKIKIKDVKATTSKINILVKKKLKVSERLSRTVDTFRAETYQSEIREIDDMIETHQSVIEALQERISELQSTPQWSMKDVPIAFNLTGIRYKQNPVVTYEEVMTVFIDTIIETRNSMFCRQDIDEINQVANEQHAHLMKELDGNEYAKKVVRDIARVYNEMSRKVAENMISVVFEDE